jgi:hypothetical protein
LQLAHAAIHTKLVPCGLFQHQVGAETANPITRNSLLIPLKQAHTIFGTCFAFLILIPTSHGGIAGTKGPESTLEMGSRWRGRRFALCSSTIGY